MEPRAGVSRVGACPALLLALAACGSQDPGSARTGGAIEMTPDVRNELDVVRRHRIVFAHHSVGQGLVEGLTELDAASGGERRLHLASLESAGGLQGSFLVHGGGGRNGDPRSKVDFFARTVEGLAPTGVELAFMKFCHVDFEPGTDVQALYAYYRDTLERLAESHPRIRFAHVTVPLVRRPGDLRSTLRRLAGLEVWEDAANARRNAFNRMLLRDGGATPVFDLAAVESVGPDGVRAVFEAGGQEQWSLHPAWTDDGGHLNAAGRRMAAAAAARFLAGVLEPDAQSP